MTSVSHMCCLCFLSLSSLPQGLANKQNISLTYEDVNDAFKNNLITLAVPCLPCQHTLNNGLLLFGKIDFSPFVDNSFHRAEASKHLTENLHKKHSASLFFSKHWKRMEVEACNQFNNQTSTKTIDDKVFETFMLIKSQHMSDFK